MSSTVSFSVAPLRFGLVAPEAVLEQKDAEHNQRSDDCDNSGNGVTSASGSSDIVNAGYIGHSVNWLGEPEKGVCAPSRAVRLLFQWLHELEVRSVLCNLLLVGSISSSNRALHAFFHGRVRFSISSSQSNDLGAIRGIGGLATTLESEVSSGNTFIAGCVVSRVTGASRGAHVVVVEIKHAGVHVADFLVCPLGLRCLGGAES